MKLLITTQAVDKNDPILGFFHGWICAFAKHFEHIYVICLKEGEHTLPANVTVLSLGKENGESNIKYIWRFYKYFTRVFFNERVDFVFFHMGEILNILAIPYFFLRKFFNTKFVWWKTHGKIGVLGKVAYAFVDEVVTAGSNSFPVATKKVRVVGHAIDTDAFSPGGRKHEEKVLRILSVGRITPIKRNDIALLAYAEFKKNFDGQTHLNFVGPETDAIYKKELEHSIADNDIKDVIFTGAMSPQDMNRVYGVHDVLLHPAHEAGFDKAVIEAMSCGIIPLTSIPSFESMLSPHGLHIRAGDVSAYAEALTKIASMHTTEREQLARGLRDYVVENHSIRTIPARIFNLS